MKKKGSKIARDIEEELRRKEEILKLVELEKKHKKKVGDRYAEERREERDKR